MAAFAGLRLIELCEAVSGEYCGKIFADLGAEVVKVERPTGSPTRAMAPIVNPAAGVEGSGLFAYLNTGKKSVVLDLESEAGAATLHDLIGSADGVIDDHGMVWAAKVGVDATTAARQYAEKVFCVITPYGLDAPPEMQVDKSINVFNSSGWAYHTPSHADPAMPPLKGAGRFMVDYEAGLDAAIALASALFRLVAEGRGEYIDISQQKVLVSRSDSPFGPVLAGEEPARDDRAAYDMPGPNGFFNSSDGFTYLFVSTRKHWLGVKALLGQPEEFEAFEDDWLEFGVTDKKIATFRRVFGNWVGKRDKQAAARKAQACGVALVPVNDASDLRNCPQIRHRQYFRKVVHSALGEAMYPTAPYRFSASSLTVSPAPLLGEHNDEIDALRCRRARRVPASAARQPLRARGGPLAGVRIVELTKVWAGPYAGKLLAMLGAEVIKVESARTLDDVRCWGGTDINHGPIFLSVNPEILSVQMNLKTRQGLDSLRALIRESDVVLNNIRPGAMERQGLGYDALREIRRDIIAVSIKMYGNEGPLAGQTGFAPSFAALGGPNSMVGYEGGPPLGLNIRYGDSSVGAMAAFAIAAALVHRRLTGEGQFVDVSAVETMANLIGDSLLAQNLIGAALLPDGNRHADMAPHGCYPARSGEWVSIAVGSDREWRALCRVLGDAGLADDPRFASMAGRQAHAAALDAMVGRSTARFDAALLAGLLRKAGVGAAKSASTRDLAEDAFLWRDGFYRRVGDGANDARPVITASWKLREPVEVSRGAPDLGEHNQYIFRNIIGVSEEAMRSLAACGAID